jgi:hypothetical protein
LRTLLFAAAAASAAGLVPRAQTPNYSQDIEPLLRQKCLHCHYEGGSAPFPLRTYEQVKKRSRLVWSMALSRKMPVCPATSDEGEFCEGGPFSDEENVLLQDWMSAGAPQGEPKEPPPVPSRAWRLGPPDAVLRPIEAPAVEAEGRPYWLTYVVPLGPNKGKRLRAFDFRVDSPQAARAATLGIAASGLTRAARGRAGFRSAGTITPYADAVVGAWSEGYPAWELPAGMSLRLDGDALAVQILYVQRGRSEPAGFELALYFSRRPHDRDVRSRLIGSNQFVIPARTTEVKAFRHTWTESVDLVGLVPEARFFCADVQVTTPVAKVFDARKWEPYWPGVYRRRRPLRLEAGTTLTAEFRFENDIHASRNETTIPRPIRGGHRETEEAAFLWLLYSPAKRGSPATSTPLQSGSP